MVPLQGDLTDEEEWVKRCREEQDQTTDGTTPLYDVDEPPYDDDYGDKNALSGGGDAKEPVTDGR